MSLFSCNCLYFDQSPGYQTTEPPCCLTRRCGTQEDLHRTRNSAGIRIYFLLWGSFWKCVHVMNIQWIRHTSRRKEMHVHKHILMSLHTSISKDRNPHVLSFASKNKPHPKLSSFTEETVWHIEFWKLFSEWRRYTLGLHITRHRLHKPFLFKTLTVNLLDII